jgi:TetR/AcrR family transcriptional regulator, copper-responsive repressor
MNHPVDKEARPRGRPRKFDESEALDAALRTFWAKGYDGTTLDDLVEATGVGRPSLYATFGDKEALFFRCLEHYAVTVGARTLAAFLEAEGVAEAVRAFLRQSVLNATGTTTPPGCIMACVAPAVDDRRVRERVAEAMAGAVDAVSARLLAAVAEKVLPKQFPVRERARAVVDVSSALTLRARLGATRSQLLADADAWATLLVGFDASEPVPLPVGREPGAAMVPRHGGKRRNQTG